jgi:hypothetical protein
LDRPTSPGALFERRLLRAKRSKRDPNACNLALGTSISNVDTFSADANIDACTEETPPRLLRERL